MQARVLVDSTAALAVTSRRGNGKLRHVRVGQLWIQQVAEEGSLVYAKVLGELNLADALTKHLQCSRLVTLTSGMSQYLTSGRAAEALAILARSRPKSG